MKYIVNQGAEIYDCMWGPVDVQEFSMRIAAPCLRRIKPWLVLPTSEFARFMNMRRKNKVYDRVIIQQIDESKYIVEGRKVYKVMIDLLPREGDN